MGREIWGEVEAGAEVISRPGCGELHGGLSSLRPRITSALGPTGKGLMAEGQGMREWAGRCPACERQAGGTRGGMGREQNGMGLCGLH